MFLCATRPNCRLGPLAMGGKGPGNHLGMKKGRLTAAFFHPKNALVLLDRRDHMPIPALAHPADRLRPGHRGGRYGRKGLPILGRAGVSPLEGYQSRFALGLFPRPWFFPDLADGATPCHTTRHISWAGGYGRDPGQYGLVHTPPNREPVRSGHKISGIPAPR